VFGFLPQAAEKEEIKDDIKSSLITLNLAII
jgi:hypothetical protein